MKLRPLTNGIFFTFTESTSVSSFTNKTKSGILIAEGKGDQSNVPRWGQVTDIGPDVKDIAVGDYVLVDAGKWTASFELDGQRAWKTDETNIVFSSDTPGTAY